MSDQTCHPRSFQGFVLSGENFPWEGYENRRFPCLLTMEYNDLSTFNHPPLFLFVRYISSLMQELEHEPPPAPCRVWEKSKCISRFFFCICRLFYPFCIFSFILLHFLFLSRGFRRFPPAFSHFFGISAFRQFFCIYAFSGMRIFANGVLKYIFAFSNC